jgi:hypothetical protein
VRTVTAMTSLRIIAAAPLSGYAELPCASERPGLVPQLVFKTSTAS